MLHGFLTCPSLPTFPVLLLAIPVVVPDIARYDEPREGNEHEACRATAGEMVRISPPAPLFIFPSRDAFRVDRSL